MATTLIKNCRNCGVQFVEPSHKIQKYCSYKCFRDFEDSSKTKRGHMTRVAARIRKGHIRKKTDKNVMFM